MDVTKLEHEAQEAEQQKKDRELRQRELSLKLKQVQEQKLLRAKLDAKKEELKKALDMWQKLYVIFLQFLYVDSQLVCAPTVKTNDMKHGNAGFQKLMTSNPPNSWRNSVPF